MERNGTQCWLQNKSSSCDNEVEVNANAGHIFGNGSRCFGKGILSVAKCWPRYHEENKETTGLPVIWIACADSFLGTGA